MEKFRERIKELRAERGLSLMDVQKRTGISNQNICRWENGQAVPSIESCIKLAEFYDVTLDQLTGRED